MYILGVATLLLLLQAMHSVLKLYVSSSIKMKGEMSRHRPKYKVKVVLPLFKIQTIILNFWKTFFWATVIGGLSWEGGGSLWRRAVASLGGIFWSKGGFREWEGALVSITFTSTMNYPAWASCQRILNVLANCWRFGWIQVVYTTMADLEMKNCARWLKGFFLFGSKLDFSCWFNIETLVKGH